VLLPLAFAQCRATPPASSELVLALTADAALAESIAAAPAGGFWLGVPGALLEIDSTGATRHRIAVAGDAVPSVIHAADGWLLLRAGGRVARLAHDGQGAVVFGEAERDEPVRLAARPGYVLRATATGAVIGLDADSLRQRWSWGRLGRGTRALALSPLDDQAYQSLAAGGDDGAPAQLLVRDLQTGRILARYEPDGVVQALETDDAGTLYALLDEDGRAVVLALRVSAEGMEPRWRQAVGPWLPEARLRVSARGHRAAVIYSGAERPGVLLDASTGARLARLDEGPVDAAFAADGALFMLRAGEVRVMR
jgi:hypothetical protein